MSKKNTPIKFLLLLLLFSKTAAMAQPSDATTAPPSLATDVNKIVCSGQKIVLTGSQDASGTDFSQYQWYKLDASGNKQLTTVTGKVYTETTAAAGYYTYQLVTQNTNGCTSPASDLVKVYVLPQLAPVINAPNGSLCSSGASSVTLTANTASASNFTLTYQWTKNGVAIPGATSSTYNVTSTGSASAVTFGVNISYVLNPACTATATKDLTVLPMPAKPMITAN